MSVMRAELDASTSTAMDTGEAQWRAGANRQAQPDAASHQQAASRAAAAKRTATAMTGEEKVAADRHRADRRNAAKRAKRAAAAEAAQEVDGEPPDVDELNDMLENEGHEPIDEFRDWCGRHDLDIHEESYCDWCADEDGGKQFHAEREMDGSEDDSSPSYEPEPEPEPELAAAAPPPPPPPAGSVTADPEEEPDPLGYLRPRCDDWQPSGGDWSPDWGDDPPSESESDDAASDDPDVALRERMHTVRHRRLSILVQPPPPPPQRMPLTARAAYHYPHLFTAEERLKAHTASMSAGEAAHHHMLAPTLIEGYNGHVVMCAFDPEGEMPYYYDATVGRQDYGAVRVSNGDRDAFYSWLEGPPEHMPPPNLSTRPLSPAPYSAQFESTREFRDEQARWFRDHGDGSELKGTRREQNTAFDRLRDKLFGARRDRANPSGTRRTVNSVGD